MRLRGPSPPKPVCGSMILRRPHPTAPFSFASARTGQRHQVRVVYGYKETRNRQRGPSHPCPGSSTRPGTRGAAGRASSSCEAWGGSNPTSLALPPSLPGGLVEGTALGDPRAAGQSRLRREGAGGSGVARPVLLQGSGGRGRRRLVPALLRGVCRARPRFGPCPWGRESWVLGWGQEGVWGVQVGVCGQGQPS